MQSRLYQLAILAAALTSQGCESGLSTVLTIEIAPDVASAYSSTSPGLVAATVDMGGVAAPVAPLCGQALDQALRLSYDHGFGCLGEREGQEVVLEAWVQPVSADWDASAFCALEQRNGSAPLTIEADVRGAVEDAGGEGSAYLGSTPEPSWPQGETRTKWRRDLSPCGGTLNGDIAVERGS